MVCSLKIIQCEYSIGERLLKRPVGILKTENPTLNEKAKSYWRSNSIINSSMDVFVCDTHNLFVIINYEPEDHLTGKRFKIVKASDVDFNRGARVNGIDYGTFSSTSTSNVIFTPSTPYVFNSLFSTIYENSTGTQQTE